MTDLTTSYLGLRLKNPLVVSSCGLTGSVDKIRRLAAAGAGAVVLKSLFEEQIEAELQENLDEYQTDYPDAYDYVRQYTKDTAVADYLEMIATVKRELDIPVIASLNCVTAAEWTSFATRLEKAGADALEINVSLLPSDPRRSCADCEQTYFDILTKVSAELSIPLSFKMSRYGSALANLISRLHWTGKVAGFVLFNRYFQPDINIDTIEPTSAGVYSSPADITVPLRWIALLSGMIESDFAASTGVHDAEGAVKVLLAGAQVAQMASTLYLHGPERLTETLEGLQAWMRNKSFGSIDQFRGRLSYRFDADQSAFERIQFMKHYAGIS